MIRAQCLISNLCHIQQMKKTYPGNITRDQFEHIRPLLEGRKRRTRPREVDLYEIFCALLYLIKSGCRWRMIPESFPKRETVCYYFKQWSTVPDNEQISLLDRVLKKRVGAARKQQGRSVSTSCCIIDAQSVSNTGTAENKGYDAGKKVSGIKRRIAVDTQGLPHAIAVTAANVTDRKGAVAAFVRQPDNLSEVEGVLADGGYTGKPFAEAVKILLGARVEIAKRSELHKFKVIPKRWVAERSFAWLEKCRRLWKNCERKLNTSLQFINLAFIVLLVRRL